MIGRRLYQMLVNLDRSERLQLHHICLKSSDKRHAVLKELLDYKIDNIEHFDSALSKTAHFFKDNNDALKAQRRFIDFACKAIENLLIGNYLEIKKEEKNFILAKIFNDRNTQELFSFYNESARVTAKEINNLSLLSELSDHKNKWLSRGQMKDDMIFLRSLLSEKYNYDQLNYYQQLYQYYSTILALYLDDSSVIFESKFFRFTEELNELSKKSPNNFLRAQFMLALARLNFKNKEAMDYSIKSIRNLIVELSEDETQKDRISRSLNYIRILTGIHYGDELSNLMTMSNEVLIINRKYDYKDSISYFLNLMFRILNNESVENIRKD